MSDIVFEYDKRTHFFMACHEVHTQIEIYYLTKGERLYFVENRTYHLSEGSVIFINSNRIHKTSACGMDPHERMLLEIHPDFLKKAERVFKEINFDYLMNQTALIVTPDNPISQYVRGAFDEICRLSVEKPFGYEEETECQVFRIFLYLERSLSADIDRSVMQSSKHQKIYEIAEYISQNMGSVTTLQDLSERFYISKYYLAHSFKEITGLSLIAFLNVTRVQRAKVLLADGTMTMHEIAAAIGLGSVTRFVDVFKRVEGMTPREYRLNAEKTSVFRKSDDMR